MPKKTNQTIIYFSIISVIVVFAFAFLVKAGEEHNVSGWAWSENIGWISLNRSDTGNPPETPFNGETGPIAQYNKDTNKITGWMRVLANGGGWDGWIKFYDATIDTNDDWHGWAWSDMVVGWVSFNSEEGGGSPYKAITPGAFNHPPTAESLSVIGGGSAFYCSSAPTHYFEWIHSDDDDDDVQTQFQFQVDDNNDFSSPEINKDFTGLSNPNPTTNNQTAIVAVSPGVDQISYNTTYYWRVKVYDGDLDSGWVSGSSFTTEPHLYPLVDFSWEPENPSAEEDVQFTDESDCYDSDNALIDCTGWLWNIPDATYIEETNSASQNPIVQFASDDSKSITLKATDFDGYNCSDSKDFDIQIKLPKWKEILPW